MRVFNLLLSILVSSYSFAQPRKVAAETAVQAVTIFTAGARVERSATVVLSQGRSEISFAGLSNQLEQQSVQLKADASITLLAVQTTKDFLSTRKSDQEEQDYIDRIRVLTDKIAIDNKLLEVYRSEEQMLIKNQAIGGQAGVKTTELKEALDLHRQRLTEVYQKQLEIQKRLQLQQQDAQRLGVQQQQMSKKRDSINYVVTALVDSKESRTVRFQLLYNIKDAGWYPTYDVRVTEVSSPLQVLMNANVFQRSGETWKDVALSLSTGNPADNATPSQLEPWKLGFYDPSVAWMKSQSVQAGTAAGRVTNERGEPVSFATVAVKGSNQATATDANGFFRLQNFPANGVLLVSAVGFQSKEVAVKPGYYSIALVQSLQQLQEVVVTAYGQERSAREVGYSTAKVKAEELQTATVATQYQPTTTVYKIDDRYTLETDGKTTTIGIKQFGMPVAYEYYTAPKADPAAFLTARVVNWQDYDLQSGEANLYFEGAFLGKTYIDLAATTDTLSLSLGKDNGVKVARKLIKEFSTKRFIGSNKTESRQYEIIVRNTRKAPVTIMVVDQIPVSITKDIDVNDIKAPEAQLDKETGIATWTITLQPGEEKKVNVSYSVKYPKERKVVLE